MSAHASVHDLATQLMATEARSSAPNGTGLVPAFRVLEKMRPHLAMLMGVIGFRALLARALVLTNAKIQWLRAVHVNAVGSLEGIEELGAQLAPEVLSEGGVALLAELLALLVNFVGEDLTVRLVCDLWPELSCDGSIAGKE